MFKNLSKKNIIIAVVIILVLVMVGLFVYKAKMNKGYSIVYLTTGEVYIGKLTTFPDLKLKDTFILQITKDAKDPTKNNFQLQPVKEALWAPEYINLTEKNVIFYGPLLETSQIAQTLAEQNKQN
ncbi:MAG: hypothetical protein WA060_01685 [Minisyncoccia bacterium]